MKTLVYIFSLALVYNASMAKGTSHHQQDSTVSPSDKTEVKEPQRIKHGDLKGPRAKNYPTHAYQGSSVVVAVPVEGAEKRMGPAAKNYRPWQDDTEVQRATITKKERKNLKGPRYKNRKPWNN